MSVLPSNFRATDTSDATRSRRRTLLRASAFGALLAAVMAPALAHAQSDDLYNTSRVAGPYVGAGVGFNFLDKRNFDRLPVPNSLDSDTGAAGLLSGGYKFGNGFRTELELGYRENDAHTAFGSYAHGQTESKTVMINGLYDFFIPESNWTPYLGVGAGINDVTFDKVGRTTPTPTATFVRGDGTEFAYQGIAGISYALDRNIKIGVDYHYLGSLDHDYGSTYGGATGTARSDYSSHEVLFNVRWEFNEPEEHHAAPPPPPPPPPPPAPPPPPPPAAIETKEFTVYFAFDSAKLDDQAKQIVSQAADYHKTHPDARIALAGHTDLAGSADYNMRLSLRRADAVRAQLIADGLTGDQIQVTALGETQPAVPTAPGVREAKNRRVVIDLK